MGHHRDGSPESHRPPGPQLDGRQAPRVLFADREPLISSASEPLTTEQSGEGWTAGATLSRPGALSVSLCSPQASLCSWGKKESQKQLMSQGSHPGGETVTKRWGSVETLGTAELSKLPTPWAAHPLQGLRMCPELTTAACPSGPGHQRSPHPHCGLLAGPSWDGCDQAADSPRLQGHPVPRPVCRGCPRLFPPVPTPQLWVCTPGGDGGESWGPLEGKS